VTGLINLKMPYKNLENQRAYSRNYYQSERGMAVVKAAVKKYRQSEKGKATAKAANKKYQQSEKGRKRNQSDQRISYMKEYGIKNKKKKYLYDKKNKQRANYLRRERYKTPEGKIKTDATNKKHVKKYRKRYTEQYLQKRKTNPEFKVLTILRSRIVDVLSGHSKTDSTIKILGCTINHFWDHLQSKFKPGMTKHNHGAWHIDHIIPCASFDLSDPEQQKICFHYTNLQPLWALDNLKKGKKLIGNEKNY